MAGERAVRFAFLLPLPPVSSLEVTLPISCPVSSRIQEPESAIGTSSFRAVLIRRRCDVFLEVCADEICFLFVQLMLRKIRHSIP